MNQSVPVAVIAIAWMTFMTIVVMFPTTPSPTADTMNYTVVVLGGVLILSLIWYYFPVYGGVHWFTGPVPNVDGHEAHKWGGARVEDGEESPRYSNEKEKDRADARVEEASS